MNYYTSFFGLKENPFVLTPDPKYLYLGDRHREVLGHLLYGITDDKGFMVVVGEVGTGKTTLCRAFINQLLKENIEVGLIYNPVMTDLELLQAINREFKLDADSETKGKLIDTLNEFLLRVNGDGRKVVLIVDEAQNLQPALMEQLRLISNLETETGKLIQIILVGQPELERILAKKEMRQLDQRIVVRGLLGPFRPKETRDYIRHRLKIAAVPGAEDGVHFSDGACLAIHGLSGGIPRLINVLADRSLLVAYAKGVRAIDKGLVKSAHQDLESSRYRTVVPWFAVRWQTAIALSVLMLAVLGWTYQDALMDRFKRVDRSSPARAKIFVSSPVPAPGPAIEKKTEEKPEELVNRLLLPLENLTKEETWRFALEGIFLLWNEEKTVPSRLALGTIPGDSSLKLWEMSGNMTRLYSFNYPAILELKRPGHHAGVYAVLKKVKDDRAVILGDKEITLPLAVLNELWYGHAYVLWKDFEELPRVIPPGASSLAVTWLQHNMKYLKLLEGPVSGFFDARTKEAVVRFQKAKILAVDGVVGPETLMALYSLLDIYQKPTLLGQDEKGTQGR